MADVRTNRRSGLSVIRRLTTTIADIRNRALTIRRPHAPTRRRELIPHRAAAIHLHLVPTPHPAAVIAVEVAAAAAGVVIAVAAAAAAVEEVAAEVAAAAVAAPHTVVGVAEAHMAAEVPAPTSGTNLFAYSKARPNDPDGPFVFRHQL